MTLSILLFTIITFLACSIATHRRYDGYKLVRTIPDMDDDLDSLRILKDMYEGEEVDFWNGIKRLGMPVDIAVSPQMEATLIALLEDFGLRSTIVITDIQALIDDQMRPSLSTRVKRDADSTNEFDYNVYHPLGEINNWVNDIAAEYPNIATKIKIGASYKKRNILALKIGRASPTGDSKPVAWFQAGIHAREWISPASIIFVTHKLLSGYGSDNEITALLDGLDIYIIPVLNVDGYAYTWTNDRLWRKTRSENSDSMCVGVDANRNYDLHWGDADGADVNPCNETYRGTEATSEEEIKAVTRYMQGVVDSGDTIRLFIDFHSYGQVWMAPWGYTEDPSDDFEDQNNLQADAVEALTAVHGTNYTYGQISQTMYKASGCSVDWAYGALGVLYSYTIELPDTGDFGFTLPPERIESTVTELFEGLKVALNHIL
ncbi:carboxypeptidase B-like [Antedon mediterranea]|uniref:carboxypeptidase B-like n=1 Tax=Antedon mediterranea TaxID=105859 RepID=UPI003AF9FA27